MKTNGKTKPVKRLLSKSLLVLCYFPLSFCLIGTLAYQMRTPSPVEGSYHFMEVFLHYANPLNANFMLIHAPALLFSLAYLLLMVTLTETSKPIITLTQIRILLLILIILITIIVHIILTSGLRNYIDRYGFIALFLYVDVHLVLLYLLTYLPVFRRLNPSQA